MFSSILSSLTVSIFFVAASAQSNTPSHTPTVRYCDLLSKPDAYDGRQIRLRAEYDSGFEHSVFADSRCVKVWDANRLIWAEFDDAAFSNTDVGTMTRFEQARYRPETDKDGRITDRWRSWRVKLTVVGVFRTSKHASFGFGHTNAYPFMIVVSKIERVGSLKKP